MDNEINEQTSVSMPPMNTQSSTKSQTWAAKNYARHAGFVPRYGTPLLDLLLPQPGERILDVGCGDGFLTAELESFGAHVIGIDSSPGMLDAARARGLKVREMDAQALDFKAEFDGVLTNAALHWMPDPDAVIAGVFKALTPTGRFIGEFGGHGNVASLVIALHASLAKIGIDGKTRNPWYFPSPAAYQRKLETHGFTVDYIELIPRPTPLPTGLDGWLETFAHSFIDGLEEHHKNTVLSNVTSLLEPVLCDEDGNWTADYVRLRFSARKIGVPPETQT